MIRLRLAYGPLQRYSGHRDGAEAGSNHPSDCMPYIDMAGSSPSACAAGQTQGCVQRFIDLRIRILDIGGAGAGAIPPCFCLQLYLIFEAASPFCAVMWISFHISYPYLGSLGCLDCT